MASPPTRIDEDIYEAARTHGRRMSRSAAQQLAHWARIGRQLELSPSTSVSDIARVLAGDADYDALNEREQAVVRATWSQSIRERAAEVDMRDVLRSRGRRTASESTPDGKSVVQRNISARRSPRA